MVWFIIEQYDEEAIATHPLGDDPITIGRDRENRVSFAENRLVSRKHIQVYLDETGMPILEDCGSTYGTRLNGEDVVAGRPYVLHDGDEITIVPLSNWTFHIRCFTVASPPTTAARKTTVLPIEVVNSKSGEIKVLGRTVHLAPNELAALQLFREKLAQGNGFVDRDELAARVWGAPPLNQDIKIILAKIRLAQQSGQVGRNQDSVVRLCVELCNKLEGAHTRVTDWAIARLIADLRQKLELDPQYPPLIMTVRGRGWRIVPPIIGG